MASIKRYCNKEGIIVSFQIRVFRGEDEKGKTLKPFLKTIKIPAKLTPRQIEKLIETESVLFEQSCKCGMADNNKILFRDFAREVIEIKRMAGNENSTISHYVDMLETRILPFFGHMKVRDIHGMTLNKFYCELASPGQNKKTGTGLAPKTILEHHRLMSTIFTQARKQQIISVNPAENATPPRAIVNVPNYYQPQELEKIRTALNSEPIKWKTMGYLMMQFGGRRGEYAGIKKQAISFERHEIKIASCVLYNRIDGIYEKPYPKGKSPRILPMSAEVEQLLKDYFVWLDEEEAKYGDLWKPSDFIFVAEGGGMMNPDTITQHYSRMTQKQRVKNPSFPHMNPHAFRHTVASLLISNGMDIVTTAGYIGDAPATVSARYAHMINDAKIRASNTMNSIVFQSMEKIG